MCVWLLVYSIEYKRIPSSETVQTAMRPNSLHPFGLYDTVVQVHTTIISLYE